MASGYAAQSWIIEHCLASRLAHIATQGAHGYDASTRLETGHYENGPVNFRYNPDLNQLRSFCFYSSTILPPFPTQHIPCPSHLSITAVCSLLSVPTSRCPSLPTLPLDVSFVSSLNMPYPTDPDRAVATPCLFIILGSFMSSWARRRPFDRHGDMAGGKAVWLTPRPPGHSNPKVCFPPTDPAYPATCGTYAFGAGSIRLRWAC